MPEFMLPNVLTNEVVNALQLLHHYYIPTLSSVHTPAFASLNTSYNFFISP